MKATTTCAIVWCAVGVSIIGAMYITKSAECLWAFLIPAIVSFKDFDGKCKHAQKVLEQGEIENANTR